MNVDRSPARLDGLAVDGSPWFVVVTSLRGGSESRGTPVLAVTPLATNAPFFEALPSWQETALDPGDEFGSVLASGDFNGDGRADLVVGAPLNNTPQADAGRMELWLGRADGFTALPDFSFTNNQVDGYYGRSLAVGDFDCDGLDDLGVGSRDPLDGRGYVDIFPGTPLVPYYDHDLEPIAAITQTNLNFGFAVASGDVNGDGCADLLVGEEGRAGIAPMVHLFLGEPILGVEGLPDASRAAEGNAELTGWGHAVALADLDGDGNDDLVVGEPERDGNGRVSVFAGVGGLTATPTLVLPGGAGTHVGAFLARGGDVDGDGFEELVVGTRPDGAPAELLLVHGDPSIADGLDVTSVRMGSGNPPQAPLSAHAVDVDGDGYSDLLAGDPELPNAASTTAGGIAVYLGGPAGLSSAASWTIAAPVDAAFFGGAVTAGDFDGNGTPDVAGGAPRSNAARGITYVHEGFPTRGIRADTGLPRFLADEDSLDFSDAWFLDLDRSAHRCDWEIAEFPLVIDPCTPENVGAFGVFWGPGGRFEIRLRVTAQDGRYGEAYTTFVSEAPP